MNTLRSTLLKWASSPSKLHQVGQGYRFGTGVLLALLVPYVIISWAAAGSTPFDDTDPPGSRSGLGLHIDHRTGCHYLTVGGKGITPRLDGNGRQICEPAAGNGK